MSLNQSLEINKVNIPENIPNISAIFFTNNSVLYKREYPLNVTFGEILSDFERNIQDEELKNKIEYSYKNEKINKDDEKEIETTKGVNSTGRRNGNDSRRTTRSESGVFLDVYVPSRTTYIAGCSDNPIVGNRSIYEDLL